MVTIMFSSFNISWKLNYLPTFRLDSLAILRVRMPKNA